MARKIILVAVVLTCLVVAAQAFWEIPNNSWLRNIAKRPLNTRAMPVLDRELVKKLHFVGTGRWRRWRRRHVYTGVDFGTCLQKCLSMRCTAFAYKFAKRACCRLRPHKTTSLKMDPRYDIYSFSTQLYPACNNNSKDETTITDSYIA